MIRKIENLIIYVDEHPGMLMSVIYATASGLLTMHLSSFVHPTNSGQVWLALTYVLGVGMVTILGWLFDRLVATLNDEDDYLRATLGLDSWVVVYWVNGERSKGVVEMTRQQAENWALKAPTACGIEKTCGVRRRFVWKVSLVR